MGQRPIPPDDLPGWTATLRKQSASPERTACNPNVNTGRKDEEIVFRPPRTTLISAANGLCGGWLKFHKLAVIHPLLLTYEALPSIRKSSFSRRNQLFEAAFNVPKPSVT
jgi:hypothetical protein